MVENEVLARLPEHLRQYIKPQNYKNYSAKDQSVWRYVMHKNTDFLSQYAHKSYLNGLKITGITKNRIPNLYGMNRILKEIGWAAVAVDGFIPPRSFMEFQAYNVLVIASEIRQLNHIEYTPAPDIIHESAGHAPMLVNPEYAAFLKRFGEIGAKAISLPSNMKMFNAIRKLSILKESKDPKEASILEAQQEIITLQNQTDQLSEMDCLRNMHWWSVEYGLIGTPKDFKLFGAGLLSSIGESKWCLSEKVKKHPYSLDVIHQKFDITQPQPHLFVTPDFAHLSKVLEEFANTMGLRKGGKEGVEKLILSNEIGTIELSTGLQISGKFTTLIPNPKNTAQAAYIQTVGPSALAYRNQEMVGHSSLYHASGFGSPIGKLKGSNLAIEDMTPSDLEAFGIVEGNTVVLAFESGVMVEGKIVTGIRNLFGKIMLISFVDCMVRFQEQILFQPQWGQFDMAIGKSIRSAYAGPADTQHFPFERHSMLSIQTPPIADKTDLLYRSTQEIMADNHDFQTKMDALGPTIEAIDSEDWLLVLDFHTLCVAKNNTVWKEKALKRLTEIKRNNPSLVHLIEDGLQLFSC